MSLITQELENILNEQQGRLKDEVSLASILSDIEKNDENKFNMIAFDLNM